MTIRIYVLEDHFGTRAEGEFFEFQKAKKVAEENELRVIEETYEFSDSELAADFTPPVTHSKEFRMTWEILNRAYFCDGIDGAEYRRIYKEWLADGESEPIDEFIKEKAKEGPG